MATHSTEPTDRLGPGGRLEAVVGELQERLRGPILRPADPAYDGARRIWNGMIDKRPGVIARCTGPADVQEVVRTTRDHGLPLAVCGGGHNVAGTALCEGGVVADLSPMRDVRVDAEARTVRVDGGATWADVDRETQAFALATPGGVVSTTGVAGLTLGGGLGWLRRKHGLSCDNLLGADVVTADGRLVRTSDAEDPDLLWGLRGGGGNFGVVTSFEFRLHEVGPEVTLVVTMYPMEDAPRILPVWRDFMTDAPDEVSSQALLWTVPEAEAFPEGAHGRPVVIAAAVHCGDPPTGARVLQPLRELGEPVVDLSGPTPYSEVQTSFDPFFPAGERHYYWKSLRLDRLDGEVIEALVAHAAERPSPHTLIPVWHHGGAMSRPAPGATAFGDRSAPYLLSLDSTWDDPADDRENVEWTRAVWRDMQRFSSGGLYLNFPGLGEEGGELVRSAYGANYERLVALKRRYDPENLFQSNQNIDPEG